MLSGSLPFDDEKIDETIRMTLEDEVQFELDCWKTISKEAQDLIVKMLNKD